jgi:excisionase family DNA binding protein
MDDEWLTIAQAAEISGYHPVYLRGLIRAQKIRAQRFGPLWQVSKNDLLAFVKAAAKSKDKRRGPKFARD